MKEQDFPAGEPHSWGSLFLGLGLSLSLGGAMGWLMWHVSAGVGVITTLVMTLVFLRCCVLYLWRGK